MRKKLFTVLNAAFITVITLTACSKSADKPAGPTYTKDQLVGTYHLTAIYKGSQNVFDLIPSCQKDDYMVLYEDNTSESVDAGEVCEPDGSSEGQWTLSGNKLTVEGQTFTIESLTEDKMVATTKIEIDDQPTDVKVELARE